jgi:hypothetical protein
MDVVTFDMRAVFPGDCIGSPRSPCPSSCCDSIASGADDSGLGGTMRRHSGWCRVGRSCKDVRVRRNSRPAQVFSSHIMDPSRGALDDRLVVGWGSGPLSNPHMQP